MVQVGHRKLYIHMPSAARHDATEYVQGPVAESSRGRKLHWPSAHTIGMRVPMHVAGLTVHVEVVELGVVRDVLHELGHRRARPVT